MILSSDKLKYISRRDNQTLDKSLVRLEFRVNQNQDCLEYKLPWEKKLVIVFPTFRERNPRFARLVCVFSRMRRASAYKIEILPLFILWGCIHWHNNDFYPTANNT